MLGSLRSLLRASGPVRRQWSAPLAASFSTATTSQPSLRFCVVGSGPAGFYVADRLLKRHGDSIAVDIIDRLPTPFGLVRSGVAPDHPDTKNVINQFSDTARSPGCNFFGNVHVGTDVTLAELRQMYHGVVLAYGAETDRRLNIPGEDAEGVLSAREFVWWYNGHPDGAKLPVDLSKVQSVAVCGIGNVALDCARVLLRPPAELAPTEISGPVLQQLQTTSAVQQVHLVARRGPVQAACTPKELKELVNCTGVATHIAGGGLEVSDEDQAEMKATRMKRRIYDLLKQADAKQLPDAQHHLSFHFFRNPVEILQDPQGRVRALKLEKTALVTQPGKGTTAVGTGEYEELPVQLVLKSIGYKSKPLEGAAFDQRRGVVANVSGRVLKEVGGEEVDQGLYVCGWLKRGPTGIIGTNLVDAEDTVASIAADVEGLGERGGRREGGEGLVGVLKERGVRYVGWEGWERIDAVEVERGQAAGKCREKVADVGEMLALAGAAA